MATGASASAALSGSLVPQCVRFQSSKVGACSTSGTCTINSVGGLPSLGQFALRSGAVSAEISATRSRFLGLVQSQGLGVRPLAERRRPQTLVTRAVATPVTPTSLAGFSQIGEPVPDGLSMSEVLKTIPKEMYKIDNVKAWGRVAITLTAVAAGLAAIAVSPWYLLPFIYVYMSCASTGLFVIGHDCGHNSFSESQLVNDVVGTLVFMPLIYPFEPWRIKHNTHHAHTNKLVVDTAWQPFQTIMYDRGGPVVQKVIEATMGPFWWIASVGHWLSWHFSLDRFRPAEQPAVIVSWIACAAFVLGALVPLALWGGPVAVVKFWLLPWIGFHFWMSTFTLVHHTAPHIPFKNKREWDQTQAQLGGTVHCEYPKWVEFLCHDISVHIPHHLSTKIPSYNLRPAYEALQQHWDKYMNKADFGLPLIGTIVGNCNLYDTRKGKYVKFDPKQRE